MTQKHQLRIVFMGTPDFAVATLEALLKENYNVVGVITAPDKKAGRGQKLKASAVKLFAQKKGLHILQPTNLKASSFIDTLKQLRANLQIVVAFRMLPKAVWQMPELGTFNLHASLLPQYRGAAPIHWAIINGEKETGVTTFFIDENIDTGKIIDNDTIIIDSTTTVGTLHDSLMKIGSKLVVKTVKQIESGSVIKKTQSPLKGLKTAYKLNKDNCKINWELPLEVIYNKIRGLNPFPAAWCYLINSNDQLVIKVFDIEKETTKHTLLSGTIVLEKNILKVACQGGFILVKEMQLPNKRKMPIAPLLNGLQIHDNAKMC